MILTTLNKIKRTMLEAMVLQSLLQTLLLVLSPPRLSFCHDHRACWWSIDQLKKSVHPLPTPTSAISAQPTSGNPTASVAMWPKCSWPKTMSWLPLGCLSEASLSAFCRLLCGLLAIKESVYALANTDREAAFATALLRRHLHELARGGPGFFTPSRDRQRVARAIHTLSEESSDDEA